MKDYYGLPILANATLLKNIPILSSLPPPKCRIQIDEDLILPTQNNQSVQFLTIQECQFLLIHKSKNNEP